MEDGVDVQGASETSLKTPLHLAARYGSIPNSRLLLDHGASVDTHGYQKEPSLYQVAYYGRLQVVNLLLKRGASVTIAGKLGYAAIGHAAVGSRSADIHHLRQRANVGMDQMLEGRKQLMIASACGKLDAVKVPLECGAGMDVTNSNEESTLFFAIS